MIIGGGMIGLLMLQLARLAGASKTALLEPVEKKRVMGRKLGADISDFSEGIDIKSVLYQYIHTAESAGTN